MVSLFADENFPVPAVRRLRPLRHDVLTAAEAGMVNRRIPDRIVLEYATFLGRAVVTLNWRDFADLHAADPGHAGIIVCEADADYDALAARIAGAIAGRATLAGALVEEPKTQPAHHLVSRGSSPAGGGIPIGFQPFFRPRTRCVPVPSPPAGSTPDPFSPRRTWGSPL